LKVNRWIFEKEMSMVNSTQDATSAAALFASLNAAAQAGSNTSATATAADTQNRFLKLLVTQMKNQDPLNPMDNAQVTTQMAQLSTVTGIDQLNATLQALSNSMTSNANQSLQAASMIGHGVLVPGNGIDLSGGTGLGGFALAQSADQTQVSIYNQSGTLVRSINLGAESAGIVRWQWDGKDNNGTTLADGSYTFAVNATQAGNNVSPTSLQFGVVNSVTQGTNGVTLSVGQLAGITMSQVQQIF
jgi:flagellar basal-body rod modification protein FlgD